MVLLRPTLLEFLEIVANIQSRTPIFTFPLFGKEQNGRPKVLVVRNGLFLAPVDVPRWPVNPSPY